jgi:hypothetical protein
MLTAPRTLDGSDAEEIRLLFSRCNAFGQSVAHVRSAAILLQGTHSNYKQDVGRREQ